MASSVRCLLDFSDHETARNGIDLDEQRTRATRRKRPNYKEDSSGSEEENDPTARLPFELLPRRDERGRFQAESPDIESVRLAQLGRGVAPSTIADNIEDVLALILPGVKIRAPAVSTLRRMRGQVTLTSEAMAAWKFASTKRILFAGWDESTKFGDSVFAMTFLVEYFDGEREEVCLRGLTMLPTGGTSKAILQHIVKLHKMESPISSAIKVNESTTV